MDQKPVDIIEQDLERGESSEPENNGLDEFGRSKELLKWCPLDFARLNAKERAACHELFRRGDISFFLHPEQQKLLDWLDAKERQTAIICISRQFGKSLMMLAYGLAYCILNPKKTVLYVAPHSVQLQTYLEPRMNMVLQYLPDDLIPHRRGSSWQFPNGAVFRISGVQTGHGVRVRGDAVSLCIIDEARDISDLRNTVDSHITPMFITTNGRLVMISTPPESPLHSFTDFYIRTAIGSGDFYTATYKQNPMLSAKLLRKMLTEQYPGGEENVIFRREYLADWTVADPEKRVTREWNPAVNDIFMAEWPGPPKPVRPYIGLDPGFADAAGIIGGVYDYKNGCLVILHEHVARGMNSDELGMKIVEIEHKIRNEYPGCIEPLRVTDIDPALMADLNARFNLRFEPAMKTPSVLTMINRLRVALLEGRIRVHERCVELRFQLSAGVFKSKPGSMEYLRTDRGSHLDLIDALKYVNLNMRWREILGQLPSMGDHVPPGHMRIGGFAAPSSFRTGVLQRPGGYN